MPVMQKPNSHAPIIAAILLFLAVLYVGSYLALVFPGGWLDFEDQRVGIARWQHYRLGSDKSEKGFWPLEQIDRQLRPDAWDANFKQTD